MTDFDLRIEIAPPRILEELDDRDKELLFGKPSTSSSRRPLEGLAIESVADDTGDAEEEAVTTQELAASYAQVDLEADALLDRIAVRARDLVLVIDPVAQPQLFAAANSLFDSETPVTRITFDMYRTCLAYAKDVGLAMGEQI